MDLYFNYIETIRFEDGWCKITIHDGSGEETSNEKGCFVIEVKGQVLDFKSVKKGVPTTIKPISLWYSCSFTDPKNICLHYHEKNK